MVEMIVIDISKGGVKKDFSGFKGKSCESTDDNMHVAMQKLGVQEEATKTDLKPEYFQEVEERAQERARH